MIVTFKSQASGDVIMFGDVAKQLMGLFGKEASDKGTLTVGELPGAISRLKGAIAKGRTEQTASPAAEKATSSEGDGDISVSIAQRAVPLLEMLEQSLQGEAPVVWGV